ncbi:hypothetical protein [Bradyrhizobium guangzhouense]|uniref:Uncharacterized protein n=1 Tax=Bradyrhizobium guangzhouense TaxID=1325095 RepID=A0AAE6C7W2_9BRAD|nr:hypothetical protein [Bradyrhizobium guangzhouense]QAU45836.1 hypothetical protein XH91_10990 [Bradyrhizobium guangzhouense]RXH03647.1 hypothetical protein EAS56_37985 [Bradyrhizobium guangzhouense]
MNPSLDLLYRLAAFGVSIYCGRKAWYGYVERKILFVSDDWWDWSRWSRQEFYRDPMPIRYWAQMAGTAFASLVSLLGAIIGWQPGQLNF